MNVLVYQIAIAAIILVAGAFNRSAWLVAVLLCIVWTVLQTHGGLLVLQLAVTLGAAWFSYQTFSPAWLKRRSSKNMTRLD